MSPARRQSLRCQQDRRHTEQTLRRQVVRACQTVQAQELPVIRVTRCLALSDRTVRRWRQCLLDAPVPCRGRPPRPASREDRNQVCRFLRERGEPTPLAALRAQFPAMRRADLSELLRRFRRAVRRKRERRQSRLQWRRPGAVWAADFKERREPLEGRYPWILAIKDLASRCQLAWLPVEEATAAVVQETYARLFAEHGPPLVLKSDNGGQFRDEGTKRLLAEHAVIPLYNPRRRPAYNGGVERANGQLAGYQEALAEFRGHPGLPNCQDAESARHLANNLARPTGWQGPTAGQLWDARQPLSLSERIGFLETVTEQRGIARAQLNFAPADELGHYQQAAVDRRAVRDALVAHDLLRILPRRQRRGAAQPPAEGASGGAPSSDRTPESAPRENGAGIIEHTSKLAAPIVGAAQSQVSPVATVGLHPTEEAQSSTHNSKASGQI